MSTYVKLDENPGEMRKDESFTHNKQCQEKIIPPAPPIHFPDDHSMDGHAEALFSNSQEYTRPIQCKLIGKMPSWVNGTFIRVGPGRFDWGESKCGHWFDGDAIAHRFTIADGDVVYQSKFLESEYHRKNKKYNRISAPGFGTWAPPDPCANIFHRIAMYFLPSTNLDNTNVNVFEIQGKIYAATELPWMLEIDKDTLDTIKRVSAREAISSVPATWLAHPHFEPDGTTWFFCVKMLPLPRYELIKIPPTPGKAPLEGIEVFAQLTPGEYGAGYFHSFAMTENYVILIANPCFYDSICSLLTLSWHRKAIVDILKYRPEYGPRFRIIDKRTRKELREVRADGMFFFHSANSYETEDEIIIDLCCHKDDYALRFLYMKDCQSMFKGETINPANLSRYRIPKKEILKNDPEPYTLPRIYDNGRDSEILGSLEMPVYNYNMVNGKDYTYCYGTAGVFVHPTLCKINVKTKESTYWKPNNKNIVPSCPFFIARPDATEEDDGVILANCTGANGEESFFLVLDAKTMTEICRANIHVELGYYVHANFFSQ